MYFAWKYIPRLYLNEFSILSWSVLLPAVLFFSFILVLLIFHIGSELFNKANIKTSDRKSKPTTAGSTQCFAIKGPWTSPWRKPSKVAVKMERHSWAARMMDQWWKKYGCLTVQFLWVYYDFIYLFCCCFMSFIHDVLSLTRFKCHLWRTVCKCVKSLQCYFKTLNILLQKE